MQIQIENNRIEKNAQRSQYVFGGLFLLLSMVLSVVSWREALLAGLIWVLIYLQRCVLCRIRSKKLSVVHIAETERHGVAKNRNLKIAIQVILILALISGLCYMLNLEFIYVLLLLILYGVTALLFKRHSAIASVQSEVFVLNPQQLICLHAEQNEYKGFQLNPFHYKKTFAFDQIDSIHFKNSHILIAVSDKLIIPRALSKYDVLQIQQFIIQYYPNLIDEQRMQEYLETRNQVDYLKLLFGLLVVLTAIAIYFLADNGRDVFKTLLCMSVALVLLLLVFAFQRFKNNR
ncbi:hypothetical protein EC844_12046 [Acinetobacter calcoaceticus]|uniref:YcxB-like protein domain-containing protein n=1 Tax=Acinetobacter calcoaceticus TaxID=471 RepID=A0A4R1XLB3_ACICA|nr:hypothetical protein EC844_12046 [Acinetobacter calcoaceticus]